MNSSVVYSRIKRLVKRKLIERFTIVVNDAELGYNVKALTGINMDTKQRDHIIEELFKIESCLPKLITASSKQSHPICGYEQGSPHICQHSNC